MEEEKRERPSPAATRQDRPETGHSTEENHAVQTEASSCLQKINRPI